MKTVAILAAAMIVSSAASTQAGILEAFEWTKGSHLQACFPDRKLPDERPQDCVLTAHPLGADTHAGGHKDKGKPPELKWEKAPVDRVEHHDNDEESESCKTCKE